MADRKTLLEELRAGVHDAALRRVYAPDGTREELQAARDRAVRVVDGFRRTFPEQTADAALFSGPGRTEIGGNHTDHQHGHVLCGSVDLDMLACAAPNGSRVIRVFSEGYAPLEIALDKLLPREEERGTSAALVRGVAAKIAELGYQMQGFDAYLTSNVLSGSGLSSSAAYEVLLGNIVNHFFCADRLRATDIAAIGQYAENVYFGKPCGLMDQMGSSVGGAISIDFRDPMSPVVQKVDFDFTQTDHALCIIDTGSCHADLTGDYAEITREMGEIAAHFGKTVLRQVPEEAFRAAIPTLRARSGDRAVLRAMHYYDDDRAAQDEAAALAAGDFDRFLALVNASGISSALHLQNGFSVADPRQQAIPLAIAVAKKLLGGTGAVRVHGGGFAGTIQAFVPKERLATFQSGIEAVFGAGKCHTLRIRPQGGCVVLP